MPTRIAFASCAYATLRPAQPAWTQIRAAKPDLLLLLGDNAYMSWGGDPENPAHWRFDALEACYRHQFQIPDFKWLVDNVPTMAIWDDHDCGPNDTVGATADPALLAASREMFDHWMAFARNDNRPHMYCSYRDLPDVQVIMLDVRTYRTLSSAANPTLLGPTQESWLWDQLNPAFKPQRAITLVCSGTGFTKGAPLQKVSDYPKFARDLTSRLDFKPDDPVDTGHRSLFLAGDIHQNHFTQIPGTRIFEAISSGVACYSAGSGDKLIADNECDNWGLITVDPDHDQVSLKFSGRPDSPGHWLVNNFERTLRISDWRRMQP